MSQLRIRDNATVRPVEIPENVLKSLNECLSPTYKHQRLKKFGFSPCCICGYIPPDLEVVYQLEGATRIERYCNKCIEKVYAREPVL